MSTQEQVPMATVRPNIRLDERDIKTLMTLLKISEQSEAGREAICQFIESKGHTAYSRETIQHGGKRKNAGRKEKS